MTDNALCALGATLSRIQTQAKTPAQHSPATTRRAAKAIALLMGTDSTSSLASVFGPTLRGVVPLLFNASGRSPLHPDLRLIMGNTGPIGFEHGNALRLNYGQPENGLSLYGGSNLNLGVGLAGMPHEEQLARSLAGADLPEEMVEALGERGVEIYKLPLRVAHRVAYGIVSDCLAHAISAERLGALNLLRSFPPTIRACLIEPLLASETSDAVRDLLLQAPILALAPSKLIANAGRRPREILKELGLPVEARALLPRALSPLRHWMLHDGRDLTFGDLPWLTPALLADLPKTGLLQHKVINLACQLLLAGLPDDEVTARTHWAARNATELFASSSALVNWMRADAEFLERAAIKQWHPKISVAAAIEAAKATASSYEKLKGTASGTSFPLPSWAMECRLPRSRWSLHPMNTPFDLELCGRRNRHCVVLYDSACRTRGVVIAEIRCPERPNSRLPTVDGQEIGATVEIVRRWGRWHLIEAKGFANGEPSASAVSAVRRLLDELNGEVI